MDLSRLKAFVVVAEELNFRRSAEILGMTQPPLTRLIAGLEDDLGTRLFERTTRQVKLTGTGVFLLKEGREIIARAEKLEHEVRAISRIKGGALSVAFSTTVFLASLPKIMGAFQERFPKVTLQLHQETRQRLFAGLRHGQFDVGFVEGHVEEDDLESDTVHDEALGVLLPKQHSLARRKQLELTELKDETIILHPRKENDLHHDTIHRLFRQSGIKPKVYVKNDWESCPVLVAIGKGVSLTILGTQQCTFPETKFVPLNQLSLPVSVVWSPHHVNPTLKGMLSFVAENAALRRKNAVCLEEGLRF